MNYIKKFTIVTEENLEVCVPSRDYYSRGNDWSKNNVSSIRTHANYNSEEEAIQEAFKQGLESFYIIPYYEFTPF